MEFGVVGGRREEHMRSSLINKNLCFCYWLRKRIGKKASFMGNKHHRKGHSHFWERRDAG